MDPSVNNPPEGTTPAPGEENISPLPKDFQLTPEMQKKIMKMMKDRAPKHENFRLCNKKCPLFKLNECFKKTVAEQRECWLGKMGHMFEQVEMMNGECQFEPTSKYAIPSDGHKYCHFCKKFNECAKKFFKRSFVADDAEKLPEPPAEIPVQQ